MHRLSIVLSGVLLASGFTGLVVGSAHAELITFDDLNVIAPYAPTWGYMPTQPYDGIVWGNMGYGDPQPYWPQPSGFISGAVSPPNGACRISTNRATSIRRRPRRWT
jgi:hypothetical protein